MFGACFCSSASFLAANVCMITEKDREKNMSAKKENRRTHIVSDTYRLNASLFVFFFMISIAKKTMHPFVVITD